MWTLDSCALACLAHLILNVRAFCKSLLFRHRQEFQKNIKVENSAWSISISQALLNVWTMGLRSCIFTWQRIFARNPSWCNTTEIHIYSPVWLKRAQDVRLPPTSRFVTSPGLWSASTLTLQIAERFFTPLSGLPSRLLSYLLSAGDK